MISDLFQYADIAVGPFVMTEDEAAVAIPSLPYADEDLVILSGVEKEHESNVYGYITTMDYQVRTAILKDTTKVYRIADISMFLVYPSYRCLNDSLD